MQALNVITGIDKVTFFIRLVSFLIQILSGEHWTLDYSWPAIFRGMWVFKNNLFGDIIWTQVTSTHNCDSYCRCQKKLKISRCIIFCVHFFTSLENTKKLLSTLEMPSLLTPTIIRWVFEQTFCFGLLLVWY